MSETRWRTWDRNPDPGFTDYTYLSYDFKKIAEFPNCLSYGLTKYLNDLNVEMTGDVDRYIQAYQQFNDEALKICAITEQNIDLLRKKKTEKIKRLGLKLAQSLKGKDN